LELPHRVILREAESFAGRRTPEEGPVHCGRFQGRARSGDMLNHGFEPIPHLRAARMHRSFACFRPALRDERLRSGWQPLLAWSRNWIKLIDYPSTESLRWRQPLRACGFHGSFIRDSYPYDKPVTIRILQLR